MATALLFKLMAVAGPFAVLQLAPAVLDVVFPVVTKDDIYKSHYQKIKSKHVNLKDEQVANIAKDSTEADQDRLAEAHASCERHKEVADIIICTRDWYWSVGPVLGVAMAVHHVLLRRRFQGKIKRRRRSPSLDDEDDTEQNIGTTSRGNQEETRPTECRKDADGTASDHVPSARPVRPVVMQNEHDSRGDNGPEQNNRRPEKPSEAKDAGNALSLGSFFQGSIGSVGIGSVNYNFAAAPMAVDRDDIRDEETRHARRRADEKLSAIATEMRTKYALER